MHSVTDRQTDGRTDGQTDGQQAYANSRSYCVAVRSAKNSILFRIWKKITPGHFILLFSISKYVSEILHVTAARPSACCLLSADDRVSDDDRGD